MATTQQSQTGRKPTYRAYSVTGTGDDAFWTPIGAAWQHRDGKGFNIPCHAMPINGEIVLREITERTPVEGGQQ